jgi:SPW repeat
MWQLWLTGLIGIWVLLSPWVFKFSSNSGALWNNIIFGAITIILAVWALVVYKKRE